MHIKVETVVNWMEEWAPLQLAEKDDPIGLQIGSPDARVTKVAVALDVTEAVVEEAVQNGAQMIVAHHPVIFRPLRSIRSDRPDGRLVQAIIKNELSVYAAHTNLDTAQGGINDMLAEALGLKETAPLKVTSTEVLYKLVVYVPQEHLTAVQEAVFAAGAGKIGNYSGCGYVADGTGMFRPEAGSDPFIGEAGREERVKEARFETIVPASVQGNVVRALLSAHPYEEPAYDMFRLEQEGQRFGLGRIGHLPAGMTLRQFAEHVKKALQVPALRYAGDGDRRIEKVAVLGGAGRSFMKDAAAAGADVYVTGDIDHHTAHDALAAGLTIVDPGHHIEQLMKVQIAKRLNERFKLEGVEVKAYASSISTEPFAFL